MNVEEKRKFVAAKRIEWLQNQKREKEVKRITDDIDAMLASDAWTPVPPPPPPPVVIVPEVRTVRNDYDLPELWQPVHRIGLSFLMEYGGTFDKMRSKP